MQHDQRFKTLLHEFFHEFFLLFFPHWAELFDFTRMEWLDKELFVDPPHGESDYLDLVAKLPTRKAAPGQRPNEPEAWVALVHVEVESADTVQPLRSRMYEYYEQLRRRHRLPVLPIGLYLRVGLDGLGWDVFEEYFWDHRLLHFEYAYVGLPALDGERYATGENVLGVALAALMRIPEERRAELRAQAQKRLVECGENAARRFLLYECVDAYWMLSEAQKSEYQRLVASEPYRGAQAMVMTLYEQRLLRVLQLQLEARFGPLSQQVRQRLESLSAERIEELLVAFAKCQTLRELGLAE